MNQSKRWVWSASRASVLAGAVAAVLLGGCSLLFESGSAAEDGGLRDDSGLIIDAGIAGTAVLVGILALVQMAARALMLLWLMPL